MIRRPPALLTGLLLCAACDRGGGGAAMDFRHNRERTGTPVATFGDDSLTAEELERRFAQMSPSARTRYQTLEQKKEYVEGTLRFELLAREAVRRGMQNDPEVVETAKKVMVQRLVQQELEARVPPVTDAELASAYEAHRSDYVRPQLFRLSDIFLAAPTSDPALRAKKRQQAEAALARARALEPNDLAAFGRLARELSEDPRSRALDGDLRLLSADELSAQYGPEVAAAAAALGRFGELSGVVETARGFHILKLQGKQAPLNLALADVKAQLQSRLLYERRMQQHERFLQELEKRDQAKVEPAALARVQVDLKAPAREAKGPTPGYLPPPSAAAPPAAPPPAAPAPVLPRDGRATAAEVAP